MPPGRTGCRQKSNSGQRDRQNWQEKLAAAKQGESSSSAVSEPQGQLKKTSCSRQEDHEETMSRGLCMNEKCLEGRETDKDGTLIAVRKQIFNSYHATHSTDEGEKYSCCRKCDDAIQNLLRPYNETYSLKNYNIRLKANKLHHDDPYMNMTTAGDD